MTWMTSTRPVSIARRQFAGSQRLTLIPMPSMTPSALSPPMARCQRSSSAHRSSQTCSCIRSIRSVPKFSRLLYVYSRMWSAGNTSSKVSDARGGHSRFFGGIFVAR
jgi:hypothetical protein